MRVLGLDLGSRRIGVAVSDRSGAVANPLTVIQRTGSRRRDHEQITALAAVEEVELVVVGLPRSLSGADGPAARGARDEAEALASVCAVPVECWDERFSTVTAERALRSGGVRGRARREVIDKVAAAVILQSWLDARASGSTQ